MSNIDTKMFDPVKRDTFIAYALTILSFFGIFLRCGHYCIMEWNLRLSW